MLVHAAGLQYDLRRVEWVRRELAPTTKLNATFYTNLAKALLLCGKAADVPQLRIEMKHYNIQPFFRTFKFEVQALLLMLHSSPESIQVAHAIKTTIALAYETCARKDYSFAEKGELDTMGHVADRLVKGAAVSRSE